MKTPDDGDMAATPAMSDTPVHPAALRLHVQLRRVDGSPMMNAVGQLAPLDGNWLLMPLTLDPAVADQPRVPGIELLEYIARDWLIRVHIDDAPTEAASNPIGVRCNGCGAEYPARFITSGLCRKCTTTVQTAAGQVDW